MSSERMLVIANSRKMGGRCVAGVSLQTGRLVRPVSPFDNGALSDEQCETDGHTPQLLDIVSFTHRGAARDPAQPENVVIADAPWKLAGRASRRQALAVLLRAAYKGSALLGNRGRAVAETVAAEGLGASLALIEPTHLRFGHGPAADAHAGSPRALFEFGRQQWSLPVTDFELGPRILHLPEGVHGWTDLGLDEPTRTLLTLSLGMAYEGWHHKLVAAVIGLR